jgi:hypothetical protein
MDMTGGLAGTSDRPQAEVSRNARYTGGVIAEIEGLEPDTDLRIKRP